MDKAKLMSRYQKKIKSFGFNYIKVEFEAELYRSDLNAIEIGGGKCNACNGEGYLAIEDKSHICSVCMGSGKAMGRFDPDDDRDLRNYFENHLLPKKLKDKLTFSQMYHDGSVDTEYTFTMKIEDAHHLVDMVHHWNEMVEEIGAECEVYGAGMHISVMNGDSYLDNSTLNRTKLRNFASEVQKLLPAMFILASAEEQSRPFGFRYPRISNDEKYSAIFTHESRCIEYRLFETCYDRPEAMIEFVGMIAKTLEYYNDTEKKVPVLGQTYEFYSGNTSVKRFTDSLEQVQIIKKQISLIKPEGFTIKELLDARKIQLSVMDRRLNLNKERKMIEKRYERWLEAYVRNKISRMRLDIEKVNRILSGQSGYCYISYEIVGALGVRTDTVDSEEYAQEILDKYEKIGEEGLKKLIEKTQSLEQYMQRGKSIERTLGV